VICLKVIRCGVFSLDVEQSIINAVPDSLDELSDVIMRPNAPELPASTKGQVLPVKENSTLRMAARLPITSDVGL
jgi:hypothetical protein